MKEILIGIGKACLCISVLIVTYWTLNGFNTPSQVDIACLLAVDAIVRHFVGKEQLKK